MKHWDRLRKPPIGETLAAVGGYSQLSRTKKNNRKTGLSMFRMLLDLTKAKRKILPISPPKNEKSLREDTAAELSPRSRCASLPRCRSCDPSDPETADSLQKERNSRRHHRGAAAQMSADLEASAIVGSGLWNLLKWSHMTEGFERTGPNAADSGHLPQTSFCVARVFVRAALWK